MNFTKALALDHAEQNIRVNAICPGSFNTDANGQLMSNAIVVETWLKSIPKSRFGQPNEVAALAAYLASDESSFMLDIAYLLTSFFVAIFINASYASSRTLLLRLAPVGESGAFFGIYALSGTATMWLGSFLVRFATERFGTQQAGMAAIAF